MLWCCFLGGQVEFLDFYLLQRGAAGGVSSPPHIHYNAFGSSEVFCLTQQDGISSASLVCNKCYLFFKGRIWASGQLFRSTLHCLSGTLLLVSFCHFRRDQSEVNSEHLMRNLPSKYISFKVAHSEEQQLCELFHTRKLVCSQTENALEAASSALFNSPLDQFRIFRSFVLPYLLRQERLGRRSTEDRIVFLVTIRMQRSSFCKGSCKRAIILENRKTFCLQLCLGTAVCAVSGYKGVS